MTPEWPNGCPLAKDSRPNESDHDATVSIGAQITALIERLESGHAVVVNLRKGHEHAPVVAWAAERGLLVRIYRQRFVPAAERTPWGNPFMIGRHGDRDACICKYAERLEASPDLLARLPELRGKALGCYCAPEACHGDVLVWKLREPDTLTDQLNRRRAAALRLPPLSNGVVDPWVGGRR